MIKMRRVTKLSAVALLCLCTTAHAGQVHLESPDGSIAFDGELEGFDGNFYFLRTSIGELRIDKATVSCEGADCPQIERPRADLVVRGSDTVGDELMPLLIEGYANRYGAAVTDRQSVEADTISLIVNEDEGTGDEMLVAEVQAAGSSTGFRALIDGNANIAMSSRPARSKEVRAILDQGRGNILDLSQEYIIAVDSILTIISPANPVDELTMEQVAGLFSGRITNWTEVGGPNMPVTVYTRPETSGTRGVFATQVLKPNNAEMFSGAEVVSSNREMSDRVTSDAGGIGYVGFASQREAKSVDLVASCGIRMAANAFSAKTEEYPLERRLRLFVDKSDLDAHTRGLLDFAISEDAEGLVRKAGFIDLGVTVSEESLNAERLLDVAKQSQDPYALVLLCNMLIDLDGANRLSTTFRFASGSAALDNKSVRDLGRMVHFLGRPENRGKEVIIVGFTDSDGAFSANVALAEGRAAVVREALLNHPDAGELAGLRIRSTGYGELSPVGCNEDFLGRKRNRRVEIWIR